ncbi:MAG: hypothetical protein HY735_17350 [Verrucomicrobia bacterium]|nr:hypothetical protein [Verrucomicrobiota bacterium]
MKSINSTVGRSNTTRELTACFHPYLTLSEGVKLAALAFTKDVNKLSCCAS